MSKNDRSGLAEQAPDVPNLLRTYDAPLKGVLVLVCRKCQKKLKSGNDASKLKKVFKRKAKQHPAGPDLHILQVPCLKLCPKDAVTVCTQHQLARHKCSIVRTRADVEALYHLCCKEVASHT